jgi:hypothetical protein
MNVHPELWFAILRFQVLIVHGRLQMPPQSVGTVAPSYLGFSLLIIARESTVMIKRSTEATPTSSLFEASRWFRWSVYLAAPGRQIELLYSHPYDRDASYWTKNHCDSLPFTLTGNTPGIPYGRALISRAEHVTQCTWIACLEYDLPCQSLGSNRLVT